MEREKNATPCSDHITLSSRLFLFTLKSYILYLAVMLAFRIAFFFGKVKLYLACMLACCFLAF
jgi:hypothetical protein